MTKLDLQSMKSQPLAEEFLLKDMEIEAMLDLDLETAGGIDTRSLLLDESKLFRRHTE